MSGIIRPPIVDLVHYQDRTRIHLLPAKTSGGWLQREVVYRNRNQKDLIDP